MRLVYPDTNVLIYLIEDRLGLAHKVRPLVYPPDEEIPVLVFSELTRMECRVQPLRIGDSGVLEAYEKLFANRAYRFVPMDRRMFDIATELRAEHGIKTPDALHLATAIGAGCDEFWTNDQRLAQAAQNRLRIVTFESTP